MLRLENEQMATDNKEIVAFLKRTLNQRADEIAELHDQMLGLQQAKDAEKDAFEAQLAQVRHEFQETKDQLTSENMLLSGKLAALEEFRVQKDELMAKFATLEEQLQKQEEGHKEYTYNLERKMVLDRDRLKKEMVQRVNVVASEFRKVSHSQMAETTKRAIRENVAISVQLTKLSDRSYDLLQENEQLKEAQVEMQKQLEMLEHNEKEMAKNSLSHQKMIWMLIRRCKEQKLLLNEYTKQREAMRHLEMAHKELQGESQALRERLQELEEEARRRVAEGQSQARLLEEEQKQRKKAKSVLARVVYVLKELLLEKPVDEEEGEFDVIFQLRRKEKLQSLLALVQQAVRGEQRLPEQELPPLRMASRERQLERYLGLGGLCREGWAAGATQEEALFLVQAISMLLPGPVPWRGRSMNQELSQPCKVQPAAPSPACEGFPCAVSPLDYVAGACAAAVPQHAQHEPARPAARDHLLQDPPCLQQQPRATRDFLARGDAREAANHPAQGSG
ncbi:cilia- and flagella-associated protein 157 isoform X1 [Alligator sinensis]|uniref:Cilia- and flagella-associated protein 157 n=1 Tax=Alligator sinensis TaxID=38654 RepID=A0A3Q0GMX5_ALLSI|nr:cilia- and flagella-associated protein 157 isoform X1 [Alligator sinensis]